MHYFFLSLVLKVKIRYISPGVIDMFWCIERQQAGHSTGDVPGFELQGTPVTGSGASGEGAGRGRAPPGERLMLRLATEADPGWGRKGLPPRLSFLITKHNKDKYFENKTDFKRGRGS